MTLRRVSRGSKRCSAGHRRLESPRRFERTYGRLVTGADVAFRSRLDSYGKLAEVIDSGRTQ